MDAGQLATRFAFSSHPLGDLGETYGDHLMQWKARSGLPISVNWTFFCQVLRLRRYERISVENRCFRSDGGRLIQNFT